MNVQCKPGVSCAGIQWQAIVIIATAHQVWQQCGFDHVTVTAITDGEHKEGSLHYAGLAVDLRTRNDDGVTQWAPGIKRMLRDTLKNALGADFDVVVEGTHIHVEYDPK